jgi:hypothetical protein
LYVPAAPGVAVIVAEPPAHIVALLTVTGIVELTFITTVDVTAGHGPAGSSVVNVRVTEPDVIDGV